MYTNLYFIFKKLLEIMQQSAIVFHASHQMAAAIINLLIHMQEIEKEY